MAYLPSEIKSLARAYTGSCLKVLAGIANSPEAPPSARVAACAELLNRGWGRPATHLIASEGETARPRAIAWLDVLDSADKLPLLEEPLEEPLPEEPPAQKHGKCIVTLMRGTETGMSRVVPSSRAGMNDTPIFGKW